MIKRFSEVVAAAILLFSFSLTAQCRVIYVSSNGHDSSSGLSWINAKQTIQAALDMASSATQDQIWVAKGFYLGFTLKAGVGVYGGFTGNERSLDARDWKKNLTTISGESSYYAVTSPEGATAATRIDGFTITNGQCGVFCYSSSPTVTNNTIINNHAIGSAGGIVCDGSAVITNNIITNNMGEYVGGIRCSGSPLIEGNVISGNSQGYYFPSDAHAGGVLCDPGSSPTIRNNIIENNSDRAIYCSQTCTAIISNNYINGDVGILTVATSAVTITSNTIVGNLTGLCLGSSPSKVFNNIVAFNQIGIQGTSLLTLSNNNVYGNSSLNYSGLAAGLNDISVDPLFKSDGHHLSILSPCINAGRKDAEGLPLVDMDGEPRIQGSTVDIGADECWLKAVLIKDSKRVAEGMLVDLDSLSITASFTDYFYIENTDRSSGIKVKKTAHGLSKGTKAHVVGSVKTDSNDERYIDASAADSAGSGQVFPLLLNNPSIGGGVLGLQSGVFSWENVYQLDKTRKLEWLQACGLNNIGLLIKTAGKVTSVGAGFFYIDDGAHLNDGTGNIGVKVCGTVPVAEGEDPIGKFVVVTGISSCEKPGNDPVRVVRTRGAGDVSLITD